MPGQATIAPSPSFRPAPNSGGEATALTIAARPGATVWGSPSGA